MYLPVDALNQQPDQKPTAKDFLNVMLLFLPIAVATLAAWWFIPWGWLRWTLVAIVACFFSIAAFIVVYAMVAATFERQEDEPSTS